MTVRLVKSATVNDWNTSLADTIDESAEIIGLVSTASLNPGQLQVPGVLVIDKEDSAGNLTPAKREYISFASISGVTLYNVTRGLAGSTAQGHTVNSLIEETPSVTHWGDLLDWFAVEHESDGTHDVFSHVRQVTVTGVSGASGLKGDLVLIPGANVSLYPVSGASGYSHVMFEAPAALPAGIPPFTLDNGYIATDTYVTPPVIVEDSLTLKSFSAVLKDPASGASLVLDVNLNATSIFGDDGRLSIAGGGTYASTASLSTTSVSAGDILTLDVDVGTGDTLTCLLET